MLMKTFKLSASQLMFTMTALTTTVQGFAYETLDPVIVTGTPWQNSSITFGGGYTSCASFSCRSNPEDTSEDGSPMNNAFYRKTMIAKISGALDIRCAAPGNNTLSTAGELERQAAAQIAFDQTFQRNRLADGTWSIIVFGVKISLGAGSSYRFQMTFADGGTEVYQVTNLTSSLNVVAVAGTLKAGNGVAQAKVCSSPVGKSQPEQ